ncbi:MAG: hypothetical protein ACREUA_03830 [Burkholderiales bacterium]
MKSMHPIAVALFLFSALDADASGDGKIGKKLVDESCAACHVSLYGDDGSAVYTRAERKVQSFAQLVSRIRDCNSAAGAGWNAEQQAHAAAYLNSTYYHFP